MVAGRSISPEGALRDANRLAFVIRGLAKFESEAAFQAARLALRQTQCNREAIPSVLLDLDPDRAIPVLCDHAPTERHTLTRWAIGRTLRHAEQTDLVLENLQEMLRSPDFASRRVGAELCGWQAGGSLRDMLYSIYRRQKR